MDIKITISLADRFYELLEDKLPTIGRRVENALTKEIGKTLRDESEIKIVAIQKEDGE